LLGAQANIVEHLDEQIHKLVGDLALPHPAESSQQCKGLGFAFMSLQVADRFNGRLLGKLL
jgi:hypothetical protein